MNSTNTGGVSFLGLLTLLFIGLKLTGYITWSWVWVLSPLWIPISIALIFFIFMIILLGLNYIIKSTKCDRKEKLNV